MWQFNINQKLVRANSFFYELFRLSEFSKQIELRSILKNDIIQLLENLNDCDSRISLLFSGKANVVSYKLRQSLTKLSQLNEDEFHMRISIGNRHKIGSDLQKLDFEIGEMELALKNDLGVFVVEFSDLTKKFSSYQELTQTIENLK